MRVREGGGVVGWSGWEGIRGVDLALLGLVRFGELQEQQQLGVEAWSWSAWTADGDCDCE